MEHHEHKVHEEHRFKIQIDRAHYEVHEVSELRHGKQNQSIEVRNWATSKSPDATHIGDKHS